MNEPISSIRSQIYVSFAKVLLKNGDAESAKTNYQTTLTFLETELLRNEVPDKLAETYEGIGDAHDFLTQKESNKKGQHLSEAVASYQKSFEVWQDLARRGKLSGANMNKPIEVAQKITKCEAALAKL